jgi:hypothetical protein
VRNEKLLNQFTIIVLINYVTKRPIRDAVQRHIPHRLLCHRHLGCALFRLGFPRDYPWQFHNPKYQQIIKCISFFNKPIQLVTLVTLTGAPTRARTVKRASFVKTVSEKAVVLKHQVELVREVALRRKEALRKSENCTWSFVRRKPSSLSAERSWPWETRTIKGDKGSFTSTKNFFCE